MLIGQDQSYGEQGALRQPGVGGAEGHLPYALWVRPQTKAQQIQAGQAARPSLQWGRGDSGDDVCVCVCVCVRASERVFLLNEEVVAVATFF